LFEDEPWPVVAASDYVKTLPHMISPWLPQGLFALGTDGFGRSEARKELRRFFEVDAECIAAAALFQLFKTGKLKAELVQEAIEKLGIDPEKIDPVTC
jgi:pyruvate dehydrogenase E1 component